MRNLWKPTYTKEEVEAEIREQLEVYRRIDPLIKLRFAATEEELVERIRASMPLNAPKIEPPRQLTAAEEVRIDNEITARAVCMRVFGNRAESDATGIPAVDEAWAARKQADLEKLLGPARRAKTELQVMIEKAVEDAVGQLRQPRPAPPRQGIMPRLAAVSAELDGSSLLTKFLQGYVKGDEEAMRAVARQLAA